MRPYRRNFEDYLTTLHGKLTSSLDLIPKRDLLRAANALQRQEGFRQALSKHRPFPLATSIFIVKKTRHLTSKIQNRIKSVLYFSCNCSRGVETLSVEISGLAFQGKAQRCPIFGKRA